MNLKLPALKQQTVACAGLEFTIHELSALDRTIVLELFAGADPDKGDMFSSDFHARLYACVAALVPDGDEEERERIQEELEEHSGTIVDVLYMEVAILTGLEVGPGKPESLDESSRSG